MTITMYYDRALLYSNKYEISTLDTLVGTDTTVKSFNGNDGVNAVIIVNSALPPTYIRVADGTFSGNQYYVTAYKFIRKDQWSCTLIRDLISESETWLDEYAHIITGLVPNSETALAKKSHSLALDQVKTKSLTISNQYTGDGEPMYSALFFYSQETGGGAFNVDEVFQSIRAGDIASQATGGRLTVSFPNTFVVPGYAGIGCFALRHLREIDGECIGALGSRLMQNNVNILDVHFVPFDVPSLDIDGTIACAEYASTIPNPSYAPTPVFVVMTLGRFQIPVAIPNTFYPFDNDWVAYKEGRKIRITSPSYSGSYEYSPFLDNNMNKLEMTYNVSIKPYGSITVVRPKYTTIGLYGDDYNDMRGLTVNDNTSVSKVDDAFVQFKRNNSMYESVFNNEIQSLALQNSWAEKQDKFTEYYADDNAQAYSQQRNHEKLGFMDVFGIGSNINSGRDDDFYRNSYNQATALDMQMNRSLRAQAVKTQQLMQSTTIANIKAQPVSVSKLDGFAYPYRFLVVLELIDLTPDGLDFAHQYYENAGHPVGITGTIRDYDFTFVSGYIIHSQDYTQTELQELNARLQGGIYRNAVI